MAYKKVWQGPNKPCPHAALHNNTLVKGLNLINTIKYASMKVVSERSERLGAYKNVINTLL